MYQNCTKTANKSLLGGDFDTYLTRDTPQTRALRSFEHVLMPNDLIYLMHTAQVNNIPFYGNTELA